MCILLYSVVYSIMYVKCILIVYVYVYNGIGLYRVHYSIVYCVVYIILLLYILLYRRHISIGKKSK